jgi:hypothetical protein
MRINGFVRCAVTASIVTAGTFGASASSYASTTPPQVWHDNATGLVLAVSCGNNGLSCYPNDNDHGVVPVVTETAYAAQYDSHAQWTPQYNTDGSVTYVNFSTGLCLDSDNSNFPWVNGTVGNVYANWCNGGDYQKWLVAWMGSNPAGFRLTDKATRHVLDSDPYGRAYMMYDNGGANQRWY